MKNLLQIEVFGAIIIIINLFMSLEEPPFFLFDNIDNLKIEAKLRFFNDFMNLFKSLLERSSTYPPTQ